jgi:hypothetical protein
MKLVKYLLQYGVTHPDLVERLTIKNFTSEMITPEDMERYANHLSDYHYGDKILRSLTDKNQIDACVERYDATDFDGLCANLIENNYIHRS